MKRNKNIAPLKICFPTPNLKPGCRPAFSAPRRCAFCWSLNLRRKQIQALI